METAVHEGARAPAGGGGRSHALDRATPRNLWIWAVVIAAAGTAVRVFWFLNWQDALVQDFRGFDSAHFWSLAARIPHGPVPDNGLLAKAFAPGYGGILWALTDHWGNDFKSALNELVAAQVAVVFASSLLTFALARRVLFGWTALIPVGLLNVSVALFELPSRVAPELWTMLLLLLVIWQAAILHEKLSAGGQPRLLLLTLSTGFTLGVAVLVNPGALIVLPLLVWWAFRGLGIEHATLFLIAAVLLPACWVAIAQANLADGLPTVEISSYIDPAHGNVAGDGSDALDRAYNVATPWLPRFAREYAVDNWNWETPLPTSVTGDSTWETAAKSAAIAFMIGYALLVLLGVIELFGEAPGSASRLLALPLPMLLLTFAMDGGNIVRVNVLPFLLIAIALGGVWCAEQLQNSDEGG